MVYERTDGDILYPSDLSIIQNVNISPLLACAFDTGNELYSNQSCRIKCGVNTQYQSRMARYAQCFTYSMLIIFLTNMLRITLTDWSLLCLVRWYDNHGIQYLQDKFSLMSASHHIPPILTYTCFLYVIPLNNGQMEFHFR